MRTGHLGAVVVALMILACGSVLRSAQERVLSVAGEAVRLVPEPERGYVFKPARKTGGLSVLSDGVMPEADGVRQVRGLSKRDIYAVENAGEGAGNQRAMARLRERSQVRYIAPLFSSNGQTVAITPEVVVRVQPGIDSKHLERLCAGMDLAIIKPLEFTRQEYLLEVLGSGADDVFAALELLNTFAWVEWAAPNKAFRARLCGPVFPDDAYFPKQWHLHNTGQSGGTADADINAPEAWEITTGDPNVVVAVIDDGVDSNHPDLSSSLVPGYDVCEDDDRPDPDPNNRHGTACAGLVTAEGDNQIGVTGVAWNCRLMPIRIRFRDPNELIDESMFATAIRWAATHGADVLSNSWGDAFPMPIIHSALKDVTRPGGLGRDGKGCVVLFAAGNDQADIIWPARYPEVIAVGATDHNDAPTWYTNAGPEMDITAPGGGSVQNRKEGLIWTADLLGVPGYSEENEDATLLDYTGMFSGTSAATPIVAGVAALILSVEPDLTHDEVRGFLTCSARDLGESRWDETYGWGRVDARAALETALARRADLNDDWRVDEDDMSILSELIDANDARADIGPVPRPDGRVDEQDLEFLERYLNSTIPEPDLVAHWSLDEAEGTVARDVVGNHDAEFFGDPRWRPSEGKVGGALWFDGVDDFVGTEYVLDPSQRPLSVFAWVKGGAPGQAIVSQLWGVNWLMADTAEGCLRTELREASHTARPLVSEVGITDGHWHRVGVTWDGANRVLYVDDIAVASDAQPSLARSVEGLNIGCGPDMTAGAFFSGLIDDVRIYNRAVRP